MANDKEDKVNTVEIWITDNGLLEPEWFSFRLSNDLTIWKPNRRVQILYARRFNLKTILNPKYFVQFLNG